MLCSDLRAKRTPVPGQPEKLNLKRNLIENELYTSSRNSELKELLRIEKSFVYFVNALSSNELLKIKIKRTDFCD
jgi:magnesium transporter